MKSSDPMRLTETKPWIGDEYLRLNRHAMVGMSCWICEKTNFEIVNCSGGEKCDPPKRPYTPRPHD